MRVRRQLWRVDVLLEVVSLSTSLKTSTLGCRSTRYRTEEGATADPTSHTPTYVRKEPGGGEGCICQKRCERGMPPFRAGE